MTPSPTAFPVLTTPVPTDTTPVPTALVPCTTPVPTALVASPTMFTPLLTALPRAPKGLQVTLSLRLGVPPGGVAAGWAGWGPPPRPAPAPPCPVPHRCRDFCFCTGSPPVLLLRCGSGREV